jgi:hypothetical protein
MVINRQVYSPSQGLHRPKRKSRIRTPSPLLRPFEPRGVEMVLPIEIEFQVERMR